MVEKWYSVKKDVKVEHYKTTDEWFLTIITRTGEIGVINIPSRHSKTLIQQLSLEKLK